jgi:hypothetical protein
MVLSIGEKIFIIVRPLFESDLRVHFIGEVQDVSETAVRVCGHLSILDNYSGEFVQRKDLRTRIFPINDAGIVINVIPREVNLEEVRYSSNDKHQRVITDHKAFEMTVCEFGAIR